MKTSYNKEYSSIFLNNQGQIEIWHNHAQNYNTSYLYSENLTIGQKQTQNNDINKNAARLNGCMEFFNFFKSADLKSNHASAAAAQAAGEDKMRLKGLTEKNF